ncbi:alpha/beta hydrolase [Lactobacillus johnsonii]|uniref:Alpha/beta hydrolase n=1 Tax=Lactobacillus johnsonii N6.2 TaxID=1408186 RepID=A0A7D9N5F5_LACJH|nr:alpha/beta hydrolase [Lactobacillus johnsonii]AHA97017.1 alpha/beta hydrolase [Lactobacillus johnsonii N6.2]
MKKKKIYLASFFVALFLFVLAGCGQKAQNVPAKRVTVSLTNTKTIPTFFFHGWGSSANAETQMANAAKKAGVSNTIIQADVSKNGTVKLKGTIPKNPIIKVNLEDNQSGKTSYVKDVITAISNKYHYAKINLVGHSMGNLQIANYINENYDNKKLPKINKVVSIAGHYDGYLGEEAGQKAKIQNKKTGEPDIYSDGFKQLLPLRKHYPRQIEVLNIYGNKEDGSNSDGSVSVASAQSYKYLINGRAKSYREVEIKGKNAQHSKLHENKEVDKLLIDFLWKE